LFGVSILFYLLLEYWVFLNACVVMLMVWKMLCVILVMATCVRADEFCWTRLVERVGWSKRKLSLERGALA